MTQKKTTLYVGRAPLDKLLASIRKQEVGSGCYNSEGKIIFTLLAKKILPTLKTLSDTKEIYYFRLRCNGCREVIDLCERKILNILEKASSVELRKNRIKNYLWYWCISHGYEIFSEEISGKIKEITKIEKKVA